MINYSFDCNDVWFVYLIARHVVKDIRIKLPPFRSRWNNCTSQARKVESGNIKNLKLKFLQSNVIQLHHKGFLKDAKVRLIDKTLLWTNQEFYRTRTLKTLQFEHSEWLLLTWKLEKRFYDYFVSFLAIIQFS